MPGNCPATPSQVAARRVGSRPASYPESSVTHTAHPSPHPDSPGATCSPRSPSPGTLALAACGRGSVAAPLGYAFVANQDGNAIAAVDLGALALAKLIPLNSAPSQVLPCPPTGAILALTPDNGTIHQIDPATLNLVHSTKAATRAIAMHLAPDNQTLYLVAARPRRLIALATEDLRVLWSLNLPAPPASFDVANYGNRAAVSLQGSPGIIRFVDLEAQQLLPAIPNAGLSPELGEIQFLESGGALVVPDLAQRRLTLIDAAEQQVITHLPLALRPDHLCFSPDGGQLFITGEGMDAVVTVYPYNTPEVASTYLVARAPGAIAASTSLLLVASPASGEISIVDILSGKVIAVVPVGSDPGIILITPDEEYAFVLNRESGDIAVLSIGSLTPNRYRTAAVLTMIPVGSRPVSIALEP